MSDEASDEFSERAKRLTPREWRVVALSIEGVASEDACAALGIAEGTLKSHKQAIRRKLGVPRGKRLERHLREHMEALPANIRPTVAAAAQAQQVPVERSVMEKRVRLLLRLTLQELLEVADNADLRAALLQQTVQRIESDDAEEARREVEDLQIAAREIRDTFERVRADIRERGRRVSSNGG
ncbi:MAG: LuxR C-terminal-related transcriptional regulator [Actinomycetota bacterium]